MPLSSFIEWGILSTILLPREKATQKLRLNVCSEFIERFLAVERNLEILLEILRCFCEIVSL